MKTGAVASDHAPGEGRARSPLEGVIRALTATRADQRVRTIAQSRTRARHCPSCVVAVLCCRGATTNSVLLLLQELVLQCAQE